jgi:hypothetical protein
MDKLWILLKINTNYESLASTTVIIKSVGLFSGAIKKILGDQQLNIFMEALINISEFKILRVKYKLFNKLYKIKIS